MNANEHELQMIAAEVLAPGMDGTTGIQAMLRHEVGLFKVRCLSFPADLHLAAVSVCELSIATPYQAHYRRSASCYC